MTLTLEQINALNKLYEACRFWTYPVIKAIHYQNGVTLIEVTNTERYNGRFWLQTAERTLSWDNENKEWIGSAG